MSESDVVVALRARFGPPEFAFMAGVRNGTGYSARTVRTADALAMGLWPSRGLFLHGFEVKCVRSDWLREKKDPAKAEEIASRCDFWWVAAASVDVVHVDELPESWGLLVVDGAKVKTVVEAKRLEQPKEITRSFLAAILRRSVEQGVGAENERAIREAINKEYIAKTEARIATAMEAAEEKYADEIARLRVMVAEFETESGCTLGSYNASEYGRAFKLALTLRNTNADAVLERYESILRNLADGVTTARASLSKGGNT